MTDEELDDISARLASCVAHAPGPWEVRHKAAEDEYGPRCWWVKFNALIDTSCCDSTLIQREEVARFIAHSLADVATFLAEVRLLKGILADMQQDSKAYQAGIARAVADIREEAVLHEQAAAKGEGFRLQEERAMAHFLGMLADVIASRAGPGPDSSAERPGGEVAGGRGLP